MGLGSSICCIYLEKKTILLFVSLTELCEKIDAVNPFKAFKPSDYWNMLILQKYDLYCDNFKNVKTLPMEKCVPNFDESGKKLLSLKFVSTVFLVNYISTTETPEIVQYTYALQYFEKKLRFVLHKTTSCSIKMW